jgi:hypothetical protein
MEEKMSLTGKYIKKHLEDMREERNHAYATASRHSKKYLNALGLKKDDLETWSRNDKESRFQLKVSGVEIDLYVSYVCTHDGWEEMLLVKAGNRCVHYGAGTGEVTYLDESLHEKLLANLRV